MKSNRIRWMIASLSTASLFGIGAVRMFLRGDAIRAIIYCLAVVIFLLITFAYYKGFLK